MFKAAVLASASFWLAANAHLAAYHPGMYCENGATSAQDLNSYSIVYPLYQLSFKDWWFHHVNGCDEFPPADGNFIDLPAGGSFTVEIASNRAKTSMSYGGRDASDWPDGATYPEDYNVPSCITSPNMHAQNRSMAAGTAFAISYVSDIKAVTPDNLAVFSVRYHTPWKRVTTYDVPAAMPPCPPGGCICAWGWVPNGCGQPNMYHQAFKCRVSGSTSTTPVAKPNPPVWCEGNPDACTKGAKQMIYWNQLEGNNIEVSGWDQIGAPKSPAYNMKLGFVDGAQNDIFTGAAAGTPPATNTGSPSGGTGAGTGTGAGAGTPPATNTGGPSGGTGTGGTGSGSSSGSGGSSSGSGSGSTPSGSSTPASPPTNPPAGGAVVTPPIKNPAPSCKNRRRRRSAEAETRSLIKKSSLAQHHRRLSNRGSSPGW